MTSTNMYRVGDYVYFENSSSNPYLIRRIEELNKTSNGNVEAKVICFYRRRDISSSLLLLADKHAKDMEEDMDEDCTDLSDVQRHQLNHRELYLSRQLDTLPATHIRGKCSVTLLNETENLKSYLSKTDTFFYSLVYDPTQKTLLADKGEIRVGSRYQADVPTVLEKDKEDTRNLETLEELAWEPNRLSEPQINRFLLVSRSVGTFARALDCNSSVRQPALHVCAASASRDITLFHAMNCIHKNDYKISDALAELVPDQGPVLCRDEMEEWSPSEASLFEEALEKYGKDFRDIQQDFLPWKTLSSIVEYYYMWKTSDRYIQQKRLKAAENESKLKQVYIPNYNKPNPNQIRTASDDSRACEGCFGYSSLHWYMWGPPNMGCKLCSSCWLYWKKYGGLKMPPSSRREKVQNHKIAGTDKELRHRPPPANVPSVVRGSRATHKTKQAFFLNSTKLTRLARRLCRDILSVRHFSRQPFDAINVSMIKAECQLRLSSNPRVNLKPVVRKWPTLEATVQQIASRSPKINSTSNAKKSLLLNNKLVDKPRSSQSNALKRPHQNGIDAQNSLGSNGTFYRIVNGPQKKKRCPGQENSPDDVLFVITPQVRELRKRITAAEQRSAARRPTKHVIAKEKSGQAIVIDD